MYSTCAHGWITRKWMHACAVEKGMCVRRLWHGCLGGWQTADETGTWSCCDAACCVKTHRETHWKSHNTQTERESTWGRHKRAFHTLRPLVGCWLNIRGWSNRTFDCSRHSKIISQDSFCLFYSCICKNFTSLLWACFLFFFFFFWIGNPDVISGKSRCSKAFKMSFFSVVTLTIELFALVISKTEERGFHT